MIRPQIAHQIKGGHGSGVRARHKRTDQINGRLFGPSGNHFSRYQVLRIVKKAARDAGVAVKGTRTHLLRHSGAIERLRQHGNPRALQLHLGHSQPDTTMRYLKTLQVEDAVRINAGVDPEGTYAGNV